MPLLWGEEEKSLQFTSSCFKMHREWVKDLPTEVQKCKAKANLLDFELNSLPKKQLY
ncbi:hypothetical protein Pint_33675 [Pistacia integerrima]|uniref:Uncharacterized protein n=1 Tax=Pistacia integerrima TaxID=434235 RepID=A0ACC0X389_9ROSI|nr:hypothetical protein Pint_33675 [Pistacia integerrima]